MIRALALNDFPPFGSLRLEFPALDQMPKDLAEVHLFTGVNGTGKTRLLAAMALVLGGDEALRTRLKGVSKPVTVAATDHPKKPMVAFQVTADYANVFQHGEFVGWCQRVPAFAYRGSAYVSDAKIAPLASVAQPKRDACLAFYMDSGHSQPLLQAIANLKIQAAMDSMNPENGHARSRATQIVHALERALSEITGQPFLFHITTFPQAALCVRWANSYLPFDLLPDGLRSIIGWMVDAVVMMDAWLQGKGEILDQEAVFLIDEPESHLHPVWQRRVLPAFQRLFPKAQMFIATHSPFVVSSLNHGWIHRLSMDSEGKVKADKPLPASAGDSYISVLEDVMGLDEWYDPETEKQISEFRSERDRAYAGDSSAMEKALKLGEEIGKRSLELRYTMGRELAQMERRLAKTEAK